MAIYRANMVAAADKALSAAYPVIRQVVGAEFFHGLAREYQRGTPSASGDLTDFGAAFDAFLAALRARAGTCPTCPTWPALEWAVHRAYGAADAPDWDAAALARRRPRPAGGDPLPVVARPGRGRVAPPDRARLDDPPARLRRRVQRRAGTLAETALVARDGFAVDVVRCGAGDAAFLAASLAGAAAGRRGRGRRSHADPDFDLGALLGRALARAPGLRLHTLKNPMLRTLIQRALVVTGLVDRLQPVVLLALRLYVSSVFFRSGLVKISDWSATLALFHDEYKVPLLPPDLAAFVGAFGELTFPVLITLGLLGRFGARGPVRGQRDGRDLVPAAVRLRLPGGHQRALLLGLDPAGAVGVRARASCRSTR